MKYKFKINDADKNALAKPAWVADFYACGGYDSWDGALDDAHKLVLGDDGYYTITFGDSYAGVKIEFMTGNFQNGTTSGNDSYADLSYRQPMKWKQDGVVGDGSFTTGYSITGSGTSVKWDDVNASNAVPSAESASSDVHYKAIRDFAKAKSTIPALIRGSYTAYGWDGNDNIFNIDRSLNGVTYKIVANLSNSAVNSGAGFNSYTKIAAFNGADNMINRDGNAKALTMDLAPFTLVGATTRAGDLSSPLRARFGIAAKLNFYTPSELAQIIERTSHEFGETMPDCLALIHPATLHYGNTPVSAGYLAFLFSVALLGRVDEYLLSLGALSTLSDLMAIQGLSMLGFKKLSLKINTIGDDASRAAYREALDYTEDADFEPAVVMGWAEGPGLLKMLKSLK